MAWNVEKIRKDFPILTQKIHGKALVYLDNAATSQKPSAVLKAIEHYYCADNANIHRAVHLLAERATQAYEEARKKTQRFIGAKEAEEIVFVRGTTEAINLVAQTYVRMRIKVDDEILITRMEHHSNIVPWQLLAEQTGAKIRVVDMNREGELLLSDFEKKIGPKTRFCAFGHVSNALGTIHPVKEMVAICRRHDVPTLIDGAQAVPHMRVNVQELGCDFYAFSAHKMYGPTGIGVLYGRREHLEEMPPYQGGGEMISSVSFEKTTFNAVPHKFEAGTPDIAGAIGLGAAMDYLEGLGIEEIAREEGELLRYGTQRLSSVKGLKIIGNASHKTGVLSFVLEGIHPHDIGTILDQQGIAIRTGHHCAQPVMEFYGLPATARASLGLYSTKAELDALVEGLERVKEVFQ